MAVISSTCKTEIEPYLGNDLWVVVGLKDMPSTFLQINCSNKNGLELHWRKLVEVLEP